MFSGGWWGILWFTAKLWMFMFVFVWLRGSLPRTRYDQFMRFGWKFLIPVTLLWVVLVAFIRGAQNGWFGDNVVTIAGRNFPVPILIAARRRRRRGRGWTSARMWDAAAAGPPKVGRLADTRPTVRSRTARDPCRRATRPVVNRTKVDGRPTA